MGNEGSKNMQAKSIFYWDWFLVILVTVTLPAQWSLTKLTSVQLLYLDFIAKLAVGLHSNNCLLCFLDSSRRISWGKQQV